MRYTITPTILQRIYEFARLYGILSTQDIDSRWMKKLTAASLNQAAFAAISIDKVPEEIDDNQLASYKNILATIPQNYKGVQDITVEAVIKTHNGIAGNKQSSGFRHEKRILPKVIKENDVYTTIEMEVKTRPEEIEHKLKIFMNWMQAQFIQNNPILLAGITHYKIAEIHPFADGNGRLSRIFENVIMHLKGIHLYYLLDTEDFYFRNRERYYDLIERSIETADITHWLEFYAEGMLDAVNQTVKMVNKVSGGAIDIHNNRIIQLTEREQQLIDIFVKEGQASGAEIAKNLGVSRQNINTILKKLHSRGLLTKIGKSTSSRYKLTSA